MKKILVPSDFSETAVYAFDFAFDIAAKSGGEICVLHALEFPLVYETTFGAQPYAFDKMALQDMEIMAQKNFEEMVGHYDTHNVKTSLSIDYGPVTETIRQSIHNRGIDLVIMGTHGVSGFKEFFVGSNTEKIVRFSSVPVFSIKKRVNISSIHNIVLPILPHLDQSDFIVSLKQLQQFFDAKLHILYVNTPLNFRTDSNIRKAFDHYIEFYQLEHYTMNIRNDMNEELGIMNFVHEIKADIIAMATHGRKGLAHLLSGSLAEDVVNHVDCPIWTYTLNKHSVLA